MLPGESGPVKVELADEGLEDPIELPTTLGAAPVGADALADLQGRVVAEDLDAAGGRFDDLEDHPDDRCLAGAVRAEKAVDPALRDRQADVVDGLKVAVRLADFENLEGGSLNTHDPG